MQTRRPGALRCFVWAGTFAALLAACEQHASSGIERGRRVYVANCTVCHNTDPALPGSIGPAVAGSERALVEARVLRAEYPPGYTPKRSTRAMVALPQLAGSIDDLAAYLASVPPR